MAKRFKIRISRFIPSFQTCRSKDPSSLPSNPVPSSLSHTPLNPKPINFHFPTAPSSKSHHTSLRRHVSSAFISVGCGFKSRDTISDEDPNGFHWEKEDKWHVVANVYEEIPRRKIYNSSVSGGADSDGDDVLPLPPLPCLTKKKHRIKKKKTTSRVRISTSSGDSCGMFSSDGYEGRDIDEEETETLVSSSRSFSTDSSLEFNPHLEITGENSTSKGQRKQQKQKKKKEKKKVKRRVSVGTRTKSVSSPECVSPARLSTFQWLIPCKVQGKVRESFAVVKKSEDPYEDFRRSMMEMILEKRMFEEQDLEQLLHCFLSLNSCEHHAIIVEAFTEIWEALYFSKTD